MIEKLSKRLEEINDIAKNILKYGFLACFILMVSANLMLKGAEDFTDVIMAREFMGVCFSIMFEVVVGAILFDLCMANKR